ncbi:molybdopterin-dependent oxidoreductase [Bacillus sp. HC-TM]
MHVVDGEIKYVETDNTGDDNYDGLHQVRACLRGRSMRRRVYNPDRLKYPMKRVGARGEGKFERISWEEAARPGYFPAARSGSWCRPAYRCHSSDR